MKSTKYTQAPAIAAVLNKGNCPFGGNPKMLVRLDDGRVFSTFRQGNLGFWAVEFRPEMTESAAEIWDEECDELFAKEKK